jgi:hypothetical protein
VNVARGADRAATLYVPVFTGLLSDVAVVSPLTEMLGHNSSSDASSGVGLRSCGWGEWCSSVPALMRYCSGSAWPTPSHADQKALETPLAAPEGGQSATVADEVCETSPASVLGALGVQTRGGPGPRYCGPTRRSMWLETQPWKCRAVEMVANGLALSHIVRGEDSRTPGRTPRVGDLSNAVQQRAAAMRAETGPGAVRRVTRLPRRRSVRGASSCPWRSID